VNGLERLYASFTTLDLCDMWNGGHDVDDLGELEEELMSRGFQTRRPNGRRNRRLVWDDPGEWGRFFSENWSG
jgi:hypothetical protein